MSRTIREPGSGSQSVDLEAEIRRMAEFVTQVARQMGLEGVTGALTIVGDGEPRACDRVHEMARQFMTRAEQMQNEVDRFMAVAGSKRG
ncbi:hypothetical protein [Dongia mobilis]|jgi:hypothetical protein|uniref:hypothetical protein n=1 Tax=Dongia sp. TaxID=1977262 RepID=UPI0026F23B99